MRDIRMYVNKSCKHCEDAQAFFKSKQIPVEVIEIGFDPIIQAGLRAANNGQGVPTPIIVSFVTQETIVGNDSTHLERIARAVFSNRSISSDTSS